MTQRTVDLGAGEGGVLSPKSSRLDVLSLSPLRR
jgi:hypothetical protein